MLFLGDDRTVAEAWLYGRACGPDRTQAYD